MKRSDRLIVLVVPMLALAIGFWLLVLSPKQKEAAELQDEIETAQARIDAASAQVAQAEQAREAFPENYSDVVKLGAAVPEENDQSTLIYDLTEIGQANGTNFRAFEVTDTGAAAATPDPPPAAETEPSTEAPPEGGTAVSAPAVPTEATAATLPIGATVGSAGLPVTPYEFKFFGEFSTMADLFADIDALVETPDDGGQPLVDGRLLTIDGFALTVDPMRGFPRVQGDFRVTTYIVPPEQGLSAGATPAGPAPAGSPDAPVPVSDPATNTAPPAATVAP